MRRNRTLRIEQLEDRRVLSANPIVEVDVGAGGELPNDPPSEDIVVFILPGYTSRHSSAVRDFLKPIAEKIANDIAPPRGVVIAMSNNAVGGYETELVALDLNDIAPPRGVVIAASTE